MFTDKKQVFRIVAFILLAITIVLSCTAMARHYTDPASHTHIMESLDEKRDTVLLLSASSAAASAALSVLPGDIGTSIADKLADLSGYFIIILCAIYLEKFLLTIAGAASFYVLIPAGCAVLMGYILFPFRLLQKVGLKLVAFGVLLALLVPSSVWVSDLVDDYYKDTIQQTAQVANDMADSLENYSEETQESSEDGVLATIRDAAGNVIQSVTGVTEAAKDRIEKLFTSMVEAVAVMIVTSCVIPILVLVFFLWFMKTVLEVPGPDVVWQHGLHGPRPE